MVIDLLKLFHLWITYFVKSWGSTSRTTLYFMVKLKILELSGFVAPNSKARNIEKL